MDQERAEFALAKIQHICNGPETVQVEVRRYLNGLPALIRMNGLGQALAFYRMKGNGSSHELIYRMVGEWLCSVSCKGRVFTHDADVLTAIARSDIHHYMAAQNEALALLEWLKKFALALLKKEN
ncbi:MAG: type III-B CRISPR module-associated protein Cmr5 [Burkholderiaceae bacterium]|nr:type III-B CRISPR module-associated protein Cmr5 [Burkholderiaceae bacterium]